MHKPARRAAIQLVKTPDRNVRGGGKSTYGALSAGQRLRSPSGTVYAVARQRASQKEQVGHDFILFVVLAMIGTVLASVIAARLGGGSRSK